MERREPVGVGKREVEQDNVDSAPLQFGKRFRQAVGGTDAEPRVTDLGQRELDQATVARIVLDKKHADRAIRGSDAHVGRRTTVSQKSSMVRTTVMNWSRSTGLVM